MEYEKEPQAGHTEAWIQKPGSALHLLCDLGQIPAFT